MVKFSVYLNRHVFVMFFFISPQKHFGYPKKCLNQQSMKELLILLIYMGLLSTYNGVSPDKVIIEVKIGNIFLCYNTSCSGINTYGHSSRLKKSFFENSFLTSPQICMLWYSLGPQDEFSCRNKNNLTGFGCKKCLIWSTWLSSRYLSGT